MSIFRSLFILVFVHLQIYYNAQQINFPNDKFEFTSTEQSNGFYVFNFKLDQLGLSKTLANNQFFTEININGFFEHQEVGLPAFPQFNQLIEVPQHGKINIAINNISYQIIDLNQLSLPIVVPHQRSISKSEDASQVEFNLNTKFYGKNKFEGFQLVSLKKKGFT